MRKDTDSMEEKVRAILEILENRYPESMCALHYDKDYELMIAVRLSAQCPGESGDPCPVCSLSNPGSHGGGPH